ncbi:hypothetical protein ACLKA6_004296 [Drosophila palustris]
MQLNNYDSHQQQQQFRGVTACGQRSAVRYAVPQQDLDMDMELDMEQDMEQEMVQKLCPVWHSDGFRCLLQHLE